MNLEPRSYRSLDDRDARHLANRANGRGLVVAEPTRAAAMRQDCDDREAAFASACEGFSRLVDACEDGGVSYQTVEPLEPEVAFLNSSDGAILDFAHAGILTAVYASAIPVAWLAGTAGRRDLQENVLDAAARGPIARLRSSTTEQYRRGLRRAARRADGTPLVVGERELLA